MDNEHADSDAEQVQVISDSVEAEYASCHIDSDIFAYDTTDTDDDHDTSDPANGYESDWEEENQPNDNPTIRQLINDRFWRYSHLLNWQEHYASANGEIVIDDVEMHGDYTILEYVTLAARKSGPHCPTCTCPASDSDSD